MRIDYIDSNDVGHWIDAHRPCPYGDNASIEQWCKGYTAATIDAEASIDNPEFSRTLNPVGGGGLYSAWEQGYKDATYHPAPFNPGDLWLGVDPDLYLAMSEETRDDTKRFRVVHHVEHYTQWERSAMLVWEWIDNYGSVEVKAAKPPWAENRPADRGIKLDWANAIHAVKRALYSDLMPNESIELPCPPYTFEADGSTLRISAGKFTKTGSKEDWQNVLAQMQQEVADMPEGIDISDGYVSVDVTVSTSVSVSIPMTALVENEDGLFMGDDDDLYRALSEGLDDSDGGMIGEWLDHGDIRHADFDVHEWEAPDITDDINQL